jgi:hypothetical protein
MEEAHGRERDAYMGEELFLVGRTCLCGVTNLKRRAIIQGQVFEVLHNLKGGPHLLSALASV